MSKIFRSGLTVKGGVFTADSASVSGSVFFTSGNLGPFIVSSSSVTSSSGIFSASTASFANVYLGSTVATGSVQYATNSSSAIYATNAGSSTFSNNSASLNNVAAASYALLSSANFASASISGSAIATQTYVTSQGYLISSGSISTASNSASLGGIAAASYAQLNNANFASASISGSAIATQTFVAASYMPLNTAINTQTSNYTLALSDAGALIVGGTSNINYTLTIPSNASVAFPIGAQVTIVSSTSGTFTISPAASVTFLYYSPTSASSVTLKGLNAGAAAVKSASNTWRIIGNLT